MRTITLSLAFALVASLAPSAQVATPITVYKTPTCGCCGKWVEHMKQNGFAPKVTDLPNLSAVSRRAACRPNLQSCHTSTIDGYTIEGHVPADVIRQLLKEKPKVAGIAVPGMPMGSPGMEQGGVQGQVPRRRLRQGRQPEGLRVSVYVVNHGDTETQRTRRVFCGSYRSKDLRVTSVFLCLCG